MIKFFRKIRQQLLTDNRFSKYLLYASGEIVLVVIGILIALQINNYNQKGKDINKEQFYLNALFEELKQDTASYNKEIGGLQFMEDAARYVLTVLDDPSKQVKDTLALLNNFKFMIAFDQQLPEPVIWQELQSTGNLALIQNRKLISELYAYNQTIKSCDLDFKNNASVFINQGRYYDSATFTVEDQDDFFNNFKVNHIPNDPKVLFTLLNSPDIYKNTKGILTGMLISKRVLRKVKNSALIPLKTLEHELKINNEG